MLIQIIGDSYIRHLQNHIAEKVRLLLSVVDLLGLPPYTKQIYISTLHKYSHHLQITDFSCTKMPLRVHIMGDSYIKHLEHYITLHLHFTSLYDLLLFIFFFTNLFLSLFLRN